MASCRLRLRAGILLRAAKAVTARTSLLTSAPIRVRLASLVSSDRRRPAATGGQNGDDDIAHLGDAGHQAQHDVAGHTQHLRRLHCTPAQHRPVARQKTDFAKELPRPQRGFAIPPAGARIDRLDLARQQILKPRDSGPQVLQHVARAIVDDRALCLHCGHMRRMQGRPEHSGQIDRKGFDQLVLCCIE